ncbi:MAG: MFS transporter [Verrucomicrobia bacterium]|nr:MFS transporter [Verrucomicrobiota bacterium]
MPAPSGTAAVRPQDRLPWKLWLVVVVLAAIQFTNTVDFMIMMPLSPQFMRMFGISAQQFAFAVSAYAFAAGLTSVAATLVLDRFDRRPALLWLCAGLAVGTLCCALADSYPALVAARIVCGAFGGLIGAVCLAAVGDLIPESHRGRATGVLMSSFSVATIAGLPAGIWLATRFSWHAPFYLLAAVAALLVVLSLWLLPPMRGHLAHPAQRSFELARLTEVLAPWPHRLSYLFMGSLTLAGMCVVPFIAAYMVGNVGLAEQDIPLLYACGGACTLFSMNAIGRVADFHGKLPVYLITAGASVFVTLALTHLPPVPLWGAVLMMCLFMTSMSGRFVPAMAMVTTAGVPALRGGFMSLNSAITQFASATATYLAGFLVVTKSDGRLEGFGTIGWVSAGLAMLAMTFAPALSRAASARLAPPRATVSRPRPDSEIVP